MLKNRQRICLLCINSVIAVIFILLSIFLIPKASWIFILLCCIVLFVALWIVFGHRLRVFLTFLRCVFGLFGVFAGGGSRSGCCRALFLFLMFFAAAMSSASAIFIFTAYRRCVLRLLTLREGGLVVVFHSISFLSLSGGTCIYQSRL